MGTATGLAPLKTTVRKRIIGTAAAVAGEDALVFAPFTGAVTAVRYIPDATLTGQATNFKTLTVRNRGQAGGGAVVAASLAFSSAPVVANALDQTAITLSVTVANRDFVAGDVLAFEQLVTGTGLITPDALVEVDLTRD